MPRLATDTQAPPAIDSLAPLPMVRNIILTNIHDTYDNNIFTAQINKYLQI